MCSASPLSSAPCIRACRKSPEAEVCSFTLLSSVQVPRTAAICATCPLTLPSLLGTCCCCAVQLDAQQRPVPREGMRRTFSLVALSVIGPIKAIALVISVIGQITLGKTLNIPVETFAVLCHQSNPLNPRILLTFFYTLSFLQPLIQLLIPSYLFSLFSH